MRSSRPEAHLMLVELKDSNPAAYDALFELLPVARELLARDPAAFDAELARLTKLRDQLLAEQAAPAARRPRRVCR